MRIKSIFDFLNEKFPVETACDFDNVGLLIGNKNRSVTKVLVALDCTNAAVDEAIKTGAQLIITHHPVIFEPIKSIDTDGKIGKLIENKISVISMHTNFDQGINGINDVLCQKIGLKNVKPLTARDGYVLKVGETDNLTADEFAGILKTSLNTTVRFTDSKKRINRVMVCSGAGGGFLGDAEIFGADALVAADIKHSVFLEADEKGICLFDAGHFETEDIAVEPLKEMLQNEFKNIQFFTNHYYPVKKI